MSQIIPIYIPTYISDQNYNPSRVLPRLFFYNGLVDCETYYIESGSINQYGISIAQNAFPYFDNYNVVSGSFPTETSRTLLFNNEAPSYGTAPTASLYTEYWEDYISLLYNPKTRLLNCSAIIPLADYVKMELNDVVNFRGNYYHLRAINDYSLKDGTCNLQLLGPIISDTLSGPPLPPPPPGFVSWSYSEISQDGTFTITNNGNPLATLTANGTGSSQIDASNTIVASLAPVNFPSSGSVTMSLNVNGGTTLLVSSSTNTTISSSFIVNTGQTYNITGSIRFNAPPTYSMDYLVVAGGGGGGTGTGGGGGAGGLKSGSFNVINNQTIPVVVGLGGAAGANGQSSSISSSFSGFISASGGGFGGYGSTLTPNGTGSVGGSGGGGTGGVSNTLISGSSGIAGQGFGGGVGRQRTGSNQSAGGGGGASQTGSSYQPTDVPSGGGAGGSGSLWLNGVRYAGGGGGYYSGTGDRGGLGGIGGGGRGAGDFEAAAVTGSVNTGGGGGGGASSGTYIAKGGGSGIVIIRYSNSAGQIANGGTVTNTGGFFYHAFTGSGNFTTI